MATPMQEDTKRSIYITWGLSLVMLALSFIFGGPYWGIPVLLVGILLILHGHFPKLFALRMVKIAAATLLLVVVAGAIFLSPIGSRFRRHKKTPEQPPASAGPPPTKPVATSHAIDKIPAAHHPSKADHPHSPTPALPSIKIEAPVIQVATGPCAINNIGGNVSGNQCTVTGPVPRNLSASEITSFAGCLSAHPGSVDIQAFDGDQDAFQYAEQWRNVFKAARWTIENDGVIRSFAIHNGMWSGTHVNVKGTLSIDNTHVLLASESPEETLVECLNGKTMPGGGRIIPYEDHAPNNASFFIGPAPNK